MEAILEKTPHLSSDLESIDFDRVATEVIGGVMARVPVDQRADALHQLRAELERCLIDAPVIGDALSGLVVRASLASALARQLGTVS